MKDCKEVVLPTIHYNIQSAKNLIQMVNSLDSDKITLDALLHSVLDLRFDLLVKRAKMFESTQEHVKNFGRLPILYFIPTDPRNVDHLTAEDKLFSQHATEQYQFINLLIYSIYKLTDPYTLSLKTKHLISCSRTLWPILNDETEDLSYPDFAVITQDYDPEEYQHHKDYDYHINNIEKVDYEITLMNWCRERSTVKLTRAEIVQNWGMKSASVKLAPQPGWLYREHSDSQEVIPMKPRVDVPSGFRKYHPNSTISDHRHELEGHLPKIGNTHQKLIDCIFDYRCHGQGFNFGQFRSLWEHINGDGSVRKSGSGSSHYALLDRHGKVVMGTFAHGDGQEYNKKTVRYLRAALNAVGIFLNRVPNQSDVTTLYLK